MGLWLEQHAARIDRANFRAHDQYLEQAPHFPYEPLMAYLRESGLTPWLDLVGGEDGAFGCVTREVDGRVVSRDLIDSVLELSFVGRTVQNVGSVLDIGAGYGRFAHRFAKMCPWVVVYCTDAIPVSRDVCRAYLNHRGLPPEWVIEPADVMSLPPIDLAVNVHSWSECTREEVVAWLEVLTGLDVRRLFIVPHTPTFGLWSPDRGGGHGDSYVQELAMRGWKMTHTWGGPACCPKTYSWWERE